MDSRIKKKSEKPKICGGHANKKASKCRYVCFSIKLRYICAYACVSQASKPSGLCVICRTFSYFSALVLVQTNGGTLAVVIIYISIYRCIYIYISLRHLVLFVSGAMLLLCFYMSSVTVSVAQSKSHIMLSLRDYTRRFITFYILL